MQLVDTNGVFKDWNTLKHEYDLQNNLYFHWMQLLSAIPSNWKNIIKQNNDSNTFTTTKHHFIRNSRVHAIQKITSKELYWILKTTIDHKPTSQKCFEKKFCDLILDWKEIYMTPCIVSSNTYTRCFHCNVLSNTLFLNKELFLIKKPTRHYFRFVKRKVKLYSIFIFIVQPLEICEIN